MSRLPSQSVRAADKPSGTTSSSDQRLRLSSTQAAQLQAHLRRPFTQLQQRIDIHGDIKHDDTSSASTRKEGSRYATAAAAAAAVAGKENASEQRHSSAGQSIIAVRMLRQSVLIAAPVAQPRTTYELHVCFR